MTETNLIMPSSMVRHAIQPAGCEPADVTTVLVTRYWVDPSHGLPERKRPGLDYFTHRELHFREFCLRSVQAQTRPPDRWLLLVSPWVYGMLPERLLYDVDRIPFAQWVIVPPGKAFGSVARAAMVGLPVNPFTVVARLDNDDAISVDFVHALGCWVVRARPESPATLVFPHGIQHDTRTGEPTVDMHTVNHFTATVTAFKDQQAGARVALPFEHAHTEIYRDEGKHPSTRRGIHQLITREPMWVETLHERNEANHRRPGPFAVVDWERFGIGGG